MQKIIVLALVVILLVAGYFLMQKKTPPTETPSDPKNLAYLIDGREVVLVNGKAENESAPGSTSKVTTQYFGNEAVGDLNGDGMEDTALLLTQNTGGSGTFYFVVAALKAGVGYKGTNAIFLGDRIAPQTTEIRNGELIVNYADRGKDEPMTARPSLGISRYLKILDGTLAEAGSTAN